MSECILRVPGGWCRTEFMYYADTKKTGRKVMSRILVTLPDIDEEDLNTFTLLQSNQWVDGLLGGSAIPQMEFRDSESLIKFKLKYL